MSLRILMILDCCHSETLLEEIQGYGQWAIVTQAFGEFNSSSRSA
ncbi:MAG: hypothetical protein ACO4AJ_07425 [Prochlorothrix sp.]